MERISGLGILDLISPEMGGGVPYFPTDQGIYGIKLNDAKSILKTSLRESVQWNC